MTTIHSPLQKQLSGLAGELEKRGTPIDDEDHHTFLKPLELKDPSPNFTELLEQHFNNSVGGRTKTAAAQLKNHLKFLLLNLSDCVLTHRWLLVSLKPQEYSKNYWLKKYELKYNATRHLVEYLENAGLVIKKKGAKYKSKPVLTRLYPKPAFARQLLNFCLDAEEPFDGDYLQYKEDLDREPAGNDWGKTIKELDKSHPDIAQMNLINEFLMNQHWACKGPVRLKYKLTALHGGRLYTRFQQLPDRRSRIRINTLINEEPICEVDFSANHLRLALAVFHGQDAGETPYEDIMELASIDDRNLAKSFVTKAMGASSRTQALSSWNLESRGKQNFVALEQAVATRYPALELFNDWGIQAQNLEGAMLREVMLSGLEKDVVALPVHDAVAVQQRHEEWAADAMQEAWDKHIRAGRPRLTVDRP